MQKTCGLLLSSSDLSWLHQTTFYLSLLGSGINKGDYTVQSFFFFFMCNFNWKNEAQTCYLLKGLLLHVASTFVCEAFAVSFDRQVNVALHMFTRPFIFFTVNRDKRCSSWRISRKPTFEATVQWQAVQHTAKVHSLHMRWWNLLKHSMEKACGKNVHKIPIHMQNSGQHCVTVMTENHWQTTRNSEEQRGLYRRMHLGLDKATRIHNILTL